MHLWEIKKFKIIQNVYRCSARDQVHANILSRLSDRGTRG